MKLILASASPRRRDLLAAAGIAFEAAPVDVDEGLALARPGAEAAEVAISLAVRKTLTRMALEPGEGRVLGADTIVVAPDGDLLAKPADGAEAARMARLLSGQAHLVVTGIAIGETRTGRVRTDAVASIVTFRTLTPAEVAAHVASGLWRGKAGGYGVQDDPSLVAHVDGSRTNVVGLPMEAVREILRL